MLQFVFYVNDSLSREYTSHIEGGASTLLNMDEYPARRRAARRLLWFCQNIRLDTLNYVKRTEFGSVDSCDSGLPSSETN